MATKKKNKYKNRFVLAYDTICEGNQCMMTGEGKRVKPLLFESHDEAFKELFDGAVSMLENKDEEELAELEITKEEVEEMQKIYATKDVAAMEKFLNENDHMNYNGEWVEAADEFIMNRKAFLNADGNGGYITGTKLK